MYRIVIMVVMMTMMTGCSFLKPKPPEVVVLPDPKCEALKATLSVKIFDAEPLDLDKYKNIEFLTVEDVNGQRWLTFSFDDYKDFAELLLELQNHIDIQYQIIEQMQEFYIHALEEDEDV